MSIAVEIIFCRCNSLDAYFAEWGFGIVLTSMILLSLIFSYQWICAHLPCYTLSLYLTVFTVARSYCRSLDYSYPPGLYVPWTICTVIGLFVPWTIRTLDYSYYFTGRFVPGWEFKNPWTWSVGCSCYVLVRATNCRKTIANVNKLIFFDLCKWTV